MLAARQAGRPQERRATLDTVGRLAPDEPREAGRRRAHETAPGAEQLRERLASNRVRIDEGNVLGVVAAQMTGRLRRTVAEARVDRGQLLGTDAEVDEETHRGEDGRTVSSEWRPNGLSSFRRR